MEFSARNVIMQSKLYLEVKEMMNEDDSCETPEDKILEHCGTFDWANLKSTADSTTDAIKYLEYMMADTLPHEMMRIPYAMLAIARLSMRFGQDNIFVKKIQCICLMRTNEINTTVLTTYIQSPEIIKFLGDKYLSGHVVDCVEVAAQTNNLLFIQRVMPEFRDRIIVPVLHAAAISGKNEIVKHYIFDEKIDDRRRVSTARNAFMSGNYELVNYLAPQCSFKELELSKYASAPDCGCVRLELATHYVGTQLATASVEGLAIAIEHGVGIDMSILRPAIEDGNIEFVQALLDYASETYTIPNDCAIAGLDTSLQMARTIHAIDAHVLIHAYYSRASTKWHPHDEIRETRLRKIYGSEHVFGQVMYERYDRPADQLRKIISWSEPPGPAMFRFIISADEDATMESLIMLNNVGYEYGADSFQHMSVAGYVRCVRYMCENSYSVPSIMSIPSLMAPRRTRYYAHVVECLKLWKSHGATWSPDECTIAIISDCLEHLIYAISTGADCTTCLSSACAHPDPAYLMYVHSTGLIPDFIDAVEHMTLSSRCHEYLHYVRSVLIAGDMISS